MARRIDRTAPVDPEPPVWVVEADYLCTVPRIKRYAAVEVRKTGAIVRLYGSTKFIQAAAGRHFFTDREALEEFLKDWLSRKAKSLADLLKEVRGHLADPLATMSVCAPPVQSVPTPTDPNWLND